MPKEQIFMGVGIALLSAVALWKTGWLLEHTRKGQWFVRRFGDAKARGIVRSFFALMMLLGVLLAANVIRPLQW